MLLFPPESVIIAEDTKGPMNAEVLPIWGTLSLSAIHYFTTE